MTSALDTHPVGLSSPGRPEPGGEVDSRYRHNVLLRNNAFR
jgi:hypothetical protein